MRRRAKASAYFAFLAGYWTRAAIDRVAQGDVAEAVFFAVLTALALALMLYDLDPTSGADR